jgi:nicotinate-nucleotide adenylyltransferase
MNKTPIYLFGGSFNPPHQGHINLLLDLQSQYQIDTITLLPNAISPLKVDTPPVANHHRLNMLELCISEHPNLCIDDYELHQTQPSYTVNTLTHFARHYQVFFIIGYDSYITLPKWYQLDSILSLCHLIVLPRTISKQIPHQLPQHIVQNTTTQKNGPITYQTGRITHVDLPKANISSTQCRKDLQNHSRESQLIIPSVLNYIRKHNLYED